MSPLRCADEVAASATRNTRGKDVALSLIVVSGTANQPSQETHMLDSLILIGAAMIIAGLIALTDPVLMGWRSRKEALVVLAIAVTLIGAGWLARGW